MKIIGTLLIAFGLVLGACGGGGESPPMPAPEPGKLPGHQVETGDDDLDALAAEADEEDVEEAPEAEPAEGEDTEADTEE
jgi:hypothetical protein